MTKDEIYQRYLAWNNGENPLMCRELFKNPVANVDVFENDDIIINHLYYLVARAAKETSFCFVFYESNTFSKIGNGEVDLINSEFSMPNK